MLYITGEVSNVNRFAEDFLMEMLDGHTTEEASKADKSLDFYDIGIAEIVLMSLFQYREPDGEGSGVP